ncbi:phage major capsid protein [Sphingomonas sp. BIUV-7]|uniref:Phage major capsid protein n=1 Tax=Sphingomonas natans TaxID=3063330 RepID=A0ABT8Y6U3_9SPHN|nr:phage major capsid protein [Sphingomonas sp. BIUV-7]MDO6414032.1 phage major capsid protein [Sphingomonas sp. BIUV-7]
MSEIEDLLRGHVESIDQALSGFEGQISTLQDAVTALSSQSRGSVARSGLAGLPSDTAVVDQSMIGRRLSISEADRTQVAAILRGNTSAMREMSDPDGGFLVPEVLRAEIESLVLRQSPIRRVARVVNFTSGSTVIPVNRRGATAGWVGELEERADTDGPQLAAVTPPGGTVYALPSASEELVDDAIINMEAFIQENVVDAIAEKETQAFIFGDGKRKPSGFLAPDLPPALDPDASRRAGVIQYIPSDTPADQMPGGANAGYGGLSGYLILQLLVRMIFAVKAGYRQAPGVAWLASSDFLSSLAKLKDGDGKPIWVPSFREDVPGMLLGYPVIECEHMQPTTAAGNFPLAFGNWQRGYVIGDRTQLNILRDPYTTKGIIKWYFRKRVHGSILNSEAIKVMKITVAA